MKTAKQWLEERLGEEGAQVMVQYIEKLESPERSEQEYVRLTTMGQLALGKSVLSELVDALDLAGFLTARRAMQAAYRAADDTWNELNDRNQIGE